MMPSRTSPFTSFPSAELRMLDHHDSASGVREGLSFLIRMDRQSAKFPPQQNSPISPRQKAGGLEFKFAEKDSEDSQYLPTYMHTTCLHTTCH
jgi:hypothetical protein